MQNLRGLVGSSVLAVGGWWGSGLLGGLEVGNGPNWVIVGGRG